MNFQKALVVMILLFIVRPVLLSGQQLDRSLISSGGEVFKNDRVGTIEFSIGEPIVEVINNNSNTLKLTQGFHQIFSSSVTEKLFLNFFAHPNPSNGVFSLTIIGLENGAVDIELYNSLGQRVFAQRGYPISIGPNQYKINVPNLAPGAYFLSFLVNDKRYSPTRIFDKGLLQYERLRFNPYLKILIF